MTRKRKITIKDVAEQAGVSVSLVSLVMNGKGKEYRIGEDITKKVVDIARELNYRPNIIAKNLRSGNTQLLGSVITDISNPFYARISRIIEDRAGELNYTMLTASTDEKFDNTKRLVEVLINKGVEGLILVPCDGSKEFIKELHRSKFPVVLLDRYFPDIDMCSSSLDNKKASQLATEHLITNGYEKIAVIAYETKMQHITDRITGYKETMMLHGLGENINVQKVNIENPILGIRHSLQQFVQDEKADAVIFMTNALTIHGLYLKEELNIVIPHNLAVVGFNRNDAFNLHYSPITYIRQPLEMISQSAIDILSERIKDNTYINKVFSEPELVVQKSSMRR